MALNHSTLLGFVILFAVGCAETPKPVSTMPDAGTVSGDPSQVQERATPRMGQMGPGGPMVNRPPLPPRSQGGVMYKPSCGVLTCECKGTKDCNEMFSSGVCGANSGQCDNGTGECACFKKGVQ